MLRIAALLKSFKFFKKYQALTPIKTLSKAIV